MTTASCFIVDAFTSVPFAGNPAAIVPLEHWLDDATLQAIAAEMNLSETAFFVPEDDELRLRWFTPRVEVDLCGHATLAAAHVIFERIDPARSVVRFRTRSGVLEVSRDGERLVMDFPSRPPTAIAMDEAVSRALGAQPVALLKARDLVAVFEHASQVRELHPDFAAIAALDTFAVCATAPGDDRDADVAFVSRFFAPAKGVSEDPVTGSAHCTLTPYWAERLGKTRMRSRQVSPRGGELEVELRGDRVLLSGQAVLVLEGKLHLPLGA